MAQSRSKRSRGNSPPRGSQRRPAQPGGLLLTHCPACAPHPHPPPPRIMLNKSAAPSCSDGSGLSSSPLPSPGVAVMGGGDGSELTSVLPGLYFAITNGSGALKY